MRLVVEIRAITVCLVIVDNDLRNARLKIAASNLPNTQESKHVNEGRPVAENGEFSNASCVDAGGVPIVVRGRESLSHGEGEQFKLLGII